MRPGAPLVFLLGISSASAAELQVTRVAHPHLVQRPRGPAVRALAFDGTAYVLASETTLRHVSTSGAVLPEGPDPACDDPALVPGDDQLFVSCGAQGGTIYPAGGGAPIVVGALAGTGMAFSAAFDGTRYLVVWDQGDTGDVFGRFVSAAGAAEGAPFAIAEGPLGQYDPAVRWTGTTFLVAWLDQRLVQTSSSEMEVRSTTVSSAGVVASTDGERVSKTGVDIGGLSLALTPSGQAIYGWWDSNTMRVFRPGGGLALGPAALPYDSFEYSPVLAVAANADGFLATWVSPQGDTMARAFDATGAPRGAAFVVEVGDLPEELGTRSVEAVGSPAGFLLASISFRSELRSIIRRLDTAGAVVGQPVGLTLLYNVQREAGLAFDGERYLVAWRDSGGADPGRHLPLLAARVDLDGSPVGGPLVVRAEKSAVGRPVVAFDGSHHIVVWADDRAGHDDIYAARVAPDGTLLDAGGFLVAGGAGDQHAPAVAAGPSGMVLVTWTDGGSPGTVRAARVDAGAVVEAEPLFLDSASGTSDASAVAWNGSHWFVTWHDRQLGQNDVFVARVSSDGELLAVDGEPLTLAAGEQVAPALAAAAGVLVAWLDRTVPNIVARAVGADGVPGAEVPARAVDAAPTVLHDGAGFLVVDGTGGSYVDGAADPAFALSPATRVGAGASAGGQHSLLVAHSGELAAEDERLELIVLAPVPVAPPDAGPGPVDAAPAMPDAGPDEDDDDDGCAVTPGAGDTSALLVLLALIGLRRRTPLPK